MVDFLKHVSKEARARIESNQKNFEKDVAEMKSLNDEELCAKMEYFVAQSQFPHKWSPGEPVYDGVIAHVMIPEFIRRIRGR